jgi:antitoxin (DNA-binding transcriptional repressor) of toxin-antitoxin stability system
MTSITLDELETKVRQVITDLAPGGEAVTVTLDGTVVATLSPPTEQATATMTIRSCR